MEDKKLNAVSTASDGAYIYAEDASGNQIKISKADLASVVAGIINSSGLYPFMARDFSGDNFNNINQAGLYYVNNYSLSISNHPVNNGSQGILIVFVAANYANSLAQVFINQTSQEFYFRTKNNDNGNWNSNWVKL